MYYVSDGVWTPFSSFFSIRENILHLSSIIYRWCGHNFIPFRMECEWPTKHKIYGYSSDGKQFETFGNNYTYKTLELSSPTVCMANLNFNMHPWIRTRVRERALVWEKEGYNYKLKRKSSSSGKLNHYGRVRRYIILHRQLWLDGLVPSSSWKCRCYRRCIN